MPQLLSVPVALALIVVIAVIISVARRQQQFRIAGPIVALRKFYVTDTAPDGLYVDIEGRGTGIVTWLLTLMGIDAVTSLQVTRSEIYFKTASLFGQRHTVVPLDEVSATHCGYSKPVLALVSAVILTVAGLWFGLLAVSQRFQVTMNGVLMVFCLIAAAVCVVIYWLRKRVMIAVQPTEGPPFGLIYQRAVIEGVPVDVDHALHAVGLLHQKVVEAR